MAERKQNSYLPKSLYARAALILIVPVLSIQLVVSAGFIQRHFDRVTRQMTTTMVGEIGYLLNAYEAAPTSSAGIAATRDLASALDVAMKPDLASPTLDQLWVWDLSGRIVKNTFRAAIDDITAFDLKRDENWVVMSVATRHGPLGIEFHRERVSASNPHQLLVLMLATSLLMTLIAYIFLRNQLRPIRRLARAAEAFGRGRNEPYKIAGATEVRSAGQAFLDMRARIERHIEQRTLMLSGVSHDLRTPLTRLTLSLSMMEDTQDVSDMRRDVDEMRQMLDAFLDFARDETLDDPVDMVPADLVGDLVATAQRGGQDVEIGEMENASTAIKLRPMAIRRALGNLLGNAKRYGSKAVISVAVSPRAVRFSVEDDGPGIAAHQRDEAVRPFSRLDRARNQDQGSGVGLGLAIALDIARQHGGTLRLEDSARLGGLKADLVLAR
ncbi:MAG: ATP-binding protein [Pseudomonadota bacterium]